MEYVELDRKRIELNELIENGATYEEILRVSVELDNLIEEYYGIKTE